MEYVHAPLLETTPNMATTPFPCGFWSASTNQVSKPLLKYVLCLMGRSCVCFSAGNESDSKQGYHFQTTQDEHSNVVVLTPKDLRLTYYFMAAWEQEPNAIKTEEAFVKYLDGVVTELSSPLDVRL